MKKFTFSLLAGFVTATAFGQFVYKNGFLSTGTTTKNGAMAPTGYTWSELQNNNGETTSANSSNGFSCYVPIAGGANMFSLADDFTVPVGQIWSVRSMRVYGYQAGTTTEPIDELYFRIWNGAPDVAGSTVVFGDLTTNTLTATTDSLMYRVFNSLYPTATAPGTIRKIWRFTGTGAVVLQPGRYWLEWTAHAINGGNLFFPPSTVVGSRGLDGWNGKQFNASTGLWAATIDDGNPTSATNYPQDFPFEIEYTNIALPIKLLSFTGKQTKDGNELTWATAEEVNFKGFQVEVSTDGSSFSALSFVKAKGSAAGNNYTITDTRIAGNTNYYYRLKQMDKDGSGTFSKVVALRTPGLKDEMWVSSFSNKPAITIRANDEATVELRITNVSGQTISNKSLVIKKGISTIDAGFMQNGVYNATILYKDGSTVTKRFVVQ